MSKVPIDDDNIGLSEPVTHAIQDDDVVIDFGTAPVAQLSGTFEPRKRKFGTLRASLLYMADDFDAPLDDFAEYM